MATLIVPIIITGSRKNKNSFESQIDGEIQEITSGILEIYIKEIWGLPIATWKNFLGTAGENEMY